MSVDHADDAAAMQAGFLFRFTLLPCSAVDADDAAILSVVNADDAAILSVVNADDAAILSVVNADDAAS